MIGKHHPFPCGIRFVFQGLELSKIRGCRNLKRINKNHVVFAPGLAINKSFVFFANKKMEKTSVPQVPSFPKKLICPNKCTWR